ncbi:MAG: di-heme oxidoredictase family protein, partial [Rubricoccaceae bacterium]|nr:di-heme oxidoredictase family protein [Rubricoccaceae bacterium]
TGVSNIPQLSEKEFHPYTDLLLHDMGSELDDGFTEGRATTSEWRTPPLWGLGLAEPFQGGRAYYLHDGRATSLDEAIQFHGGEAAGTRAAFNALSEAEKAQIIAFLNSL